MPGTVIAGLRENGWSVLRISGQALVLPAFFVVGVLAVRQFGLAVLPLVVVSFIGLAVLLLGSVSFDMLLKAAYDRRREDWIREGRPSGFYWKPRECSWFGSGMRAQGLMLQWLFKTPAWADGVPEAKRWLNAYRMCFLSWNVGFLVTLGIGVWFANHGVR